MGVCASKDSVVTANSLSRNGSVKRKHLETNNNHANGAKKSLIEDKTKGNGSIVTGNIEIVRETEEKKEELSHLDIDEISYDSPSPKRKLSSSPSIQPFTSQTTLQSGIVDTGKTFKVQAQIVAPASTPVTHVEERSASETLDSTEEKDGNYFLAVCNADEEKLKKLIVAVEELQKTQEVINSEDAQGRIAALVGKTNLLINQRFKQFRELCAKNLSQKPGDDKPTLNDDLQGFWDMVLLPVHELEDSFKEIHVLAANGWKMPEVKPPMRVNSRPASARTAIAVPQTAEERAAAKAAKEAKKAKAAEAAKARAEMRKKLMEAKKEAKNKEPAVEIFIA